MCVKRFAFIESFLHSFPHIHAQILATRMDTDSIFSAEQIKIPPDLIQVLRAFTKAAIKENPENLIDFSYLYFKKAVEDNQKTNSILGDA